MPKTPSILMHFKSHKSGADDRNTFLKLKDVDALTRYRIDTAPTLEEQVQVTSGSKFLEHINLPAPKFGTDANVVKSMIFHRDYVPARVPKRRLHFTQRSPFSRKRGSPHGFRQLPDLLHSRPWTPDIESLRLLEDDTDFCEWLHVDIVQKPGSPPARVSRKAIVGATYARQWLTLNKLDLSAQPVRPTLKAKEAGHKRFPAVCHFRQWHTITGAGADCVDVIGEGGCNARAPVKFCKPKSLTRHRNSMLLRCDSW